MMRKLRRRAKGKESFLTSLLESPPPPATRQVSSGKIVAHPVEIMKIPGMEKTNGMTVLPARQAPHPGLTVSSELTDPSYAFAVRSDASAYHDERFFGIEEDESGWKMFAVWKAQGSGPVPKGIQMVSQFSSIFNTLFNMLIGQRGLMQDIRTKGDSGPQKGLLSFFCGEED